uniref:Endonuclease/exonuclease/phosphatase domain-containing protein n=1 Tax=Aegilops tauschii subsp. strangulata TaxID=200361 RepID=A0A453DB41_AEGTS
MSYSWEDLFPLVSVRKLVRDISDHNPLLLSLKADKTEPPKKKEFCFDISWLSNELFLPKAREIWGQPVNSNDPIDILNIKLKRFKRYFKGWGSHVF